MNVDYYAVAVGVIVIAIAGAVWLSKDAKRIHDRLDAFKRAAQHAYTEKQLWQIRSELIEFANRECWHRVLVEKARGILDYVDGKLEGMKNGQ